LIWLGETTDPAAVAGSADKLAKECEAQMNVAESSVRYPITVIVRVLLVLVFGYVSLTFLTVELKPETQEPILLVSTSFPGAAPEEVEGEVTTRFEEAISGVSNMLYTQSISSYGLSQVTVFYKPGTNLDLSASELQRNLNRVTDLPRTVQKPQIFKASDQVLYFRHFCIVMKISAESG